MRRPWVLGAAAVCLAWTATAGEFVPLKLIPNPDGSAPLDCAKQLGALEYVQKQVKTAEKNRSISWELLANYNETKADWLECVAEGQRTYIKRLELDYNTVADALNKVAKGEGGVAEAVNAKVEEISAAYSTCDSAVPHPDEKGLCLKEQAVSQCTQSNAQRFFQAEEKRAGGPWGHVVRAVTSGAYLRKLNLQECMLKEAERTIDWCVAKNGSDGPPSAPVKSDERAKPPAKEKKKAPKNPYVPDKRT